MLHARKHLRDSIEVTKVHKANRPTEHARSVFKLSGALLQDTVDESYAEAITLHDDAENTLRKVKPDIVGFNTEGVYDDLVPIFWR
jgi:hypothetical protein